MIPYQEDERVDGTGTGATPRPWHEHEADCCGVIYGPIADGSPFLADVFAGSTRKANRSLIVSAVNDRDRLLAIEAAARALIAEPSNARPGLVDALREALRDPR